MAKLGRPTKSESLRRSLEWRNQTNDGYQSWPVLAGYFDGDGNIEEVVGKFVIMVKIGFKDNWEKQLLAVRGFLDRNAVTSGGLTKNFHQRSISAWQLRITNVAGVLEMSRQMLPYVFKKRTELKGVLDYLEDRITGDELIALVNNEVEIGNKTGKIKLAKLPFLRSEGEALRYGYSLERARKARRSRIQGATVASRYSNTESF